MRTGTEFTSVAQLQNYTLARGGGWEPLTTTQKAYTRIYALCCRYNITLAEVEEGLAHMIEHATNATRKKVYSCIANAIAQREKRMEYRTKVTLASVTEEFAHDCYQRNYGCIQSMKSHKVLPVLPRGDAPSPAPDPYLDQRQGDTNSFIDRFLGRE